MSINDVLDRSSALAHAFELKTVRHVRTPAGVRHFGQPIGSIIVADRKLRNLMATNEGDYEGWDVVKAPDGTRYSLGYDDEDGKWIATEGLEGWEAVVSADSEEELYDALDSHLGKKKGGKAPKSGDTSKPKKREKIKVTWDDLSDREAESIRGWDTIVRDWYFEAREDGETHAEARKLAQRFDKVSEDWSRQDFNAYKRDRKNGATMREAMDNLVDGKKKKDDDNRREKNRQANLIQGRGRAVAGLPEGYEVRYGKSGDGRVIVRGTGPNDRQVRGYQNDNGWVMYFEGEQGWLSSGMKPTPKAAFDEMLRRNGGSGNKGKIKATQVNNASKQVVGFLDEYHNANVNSRTGKGPRLKRAEAQLARLEKEFGIKFTPLKNGFEFTDDQGKVHKFKYKPGADGGRAERVGAKPKAKDRTYRIS